MKTLVSVIIPCYNHSGYLQEAVESVLNQSYKDWECIVVNDGSTDDTEATAMQLLQKDKRICYYKKPNGGLSSARNFGIEKSKGTILLPLDGDDKIHKDYLEKAVVSFANPAIKIVYCEGEYFGEKQGKIPHPEYNEQELARMNMIFCTALFHKKDFMAAGGYNTNMRYGWEDWNLWISLLKNGGGVYKIPEVLFYYRIKPNSMLASLEGKRKQAMYMQLYLNHPDFFDRFYSEPIEIFDKYRDLQDYSNTIEKAYDLLKGLLKLRPKAYTTLFRKIFLARTNDKDKVRRFSQNL